MFNREEINVPVLTLDLRIQPLVKSVVSKMLLSEQDCQAAIESAVDAAVSNFDWQGQIRKDVEYTINKEVTSLVSSLVHKLLWDEEINAHFKKAIAKALSQ